MKLDPGVDVVAVDGFRRTLVGLKLSSANPRVAIDAVSDGP